MNMNKLAYENKLLDSGHENIGNGLFANVFAKPGSDKVIKVGKEYDAWPNYAKWATENGFAGKFAPYIFNLKFKDGYYIAVMERLVDTIAEIRDDVGKNNLPYQLFDAASPGWRFEKQNFHGAKDFEFFLKRLRDARMANDLHAGNFMVRDDGQIVVTDPSSRSSSGHNFRIKSGSLRN